MQSEVIRLIWHHCEGVLLVFFVFFMCVWLCVFMPVCS